jgi:methionyl-tRNA synthetase
MEKSKYLTTPIFYVNADPHLGHIYTQIAGDILARFWRFCGANVWYLTGTDEHGEKVEKAAQEKNLDPQVHVDQLAQTFIRLADEYLITYDDFIRTTQDRHKKAASALWQELEQKGQIYLGYYEGWYATRDEAFYQEDELVDGHAPTGAPVEWIQEPCYFFRLSHWQEPLLKYYEEHPDLVLPKSRFNETIQFVKGGLNDLAVSRSRLRWGIPVPGSSQHVMYVWIDALTNYISALGYPDRSSERFEGFWKESIHLLGKDILRFHAVYWPAFLMAVGLQPPKRLFIHGWWTREKQKMSKSLKNVVDPFALKKEYGIDAIRYFLFREIAFGQDGDFSDTGLKQRFNVELANDFGNLIQRVLSFIQKEFHGKIPQLNQPDAEAIRFLNWGKNSLETLTAFMEDQDLYKYLDFLIQSVREANVYISNLAPWRLKNGNAEDKKQMENGLHAICMFLRDVTLFFQPVIPVAAPCILRQLGISEKEATSFESLGQPLTRETLPTPEIVFPKFEEC